MAFALLYPEEQDKFLSEACLTSPNGFACNGINNTKGLAYKKPYQMLWQAKNAFSLQKYEQSLSLLNQIKSDYYNNKLGYFKFKNFWKIHPKEVMSGLGNFSSLIDQDTFDKVVAWACKDTAEASCSNIPSFCDKILAKTDFSRAALDEELSYVRLRECKDDWKSDLPLEMSEEAANLFYAKFRLKKHNDLRPLRDMLVGNASYDVKKEIAETMVRHGDLSRDDKERLSHFKKMDVNRQPASSE